MREKYRTKRLRRGWRRVGSAWTLVPGYLALIMNRLLIGLDVPLLSTNSKTDDDLMLLTQIEIFRTKTSWIEKEMSKAGADWPNALLLTAIHVVGPTITSAYSQNSSWLSLGTPAPPSSLQWLEATGMGPTIKSQPEIQNFCSTNACPSILAFYVHDCSLFISPRKTVTHCTFN